MIKGMKRKGDKVAGPKRTRSAGPDPEAERAFVGDLGSAYAEWKSVIAAMRRDRLERELVRARLVDMAQARAASVHWLRHRVIYLWQEALRAEHGLETPEKVQERIDALDVSRKLPRWHIDQFTGEHIGASEMAKTATAAKVKSDRAPRRTIGSLMVEVLRRATVPTNDGIVALVKREFPDSKFDGKHCSWYKGAFNAGKLPGQTKKEAFNQPEVRVKSEKVEKPARKGTPKKSKVTKKAVAAALKGGPKRKAAAPAAE